MSGSENVKLEEKTEDKDTEKEASEGEEVEEVKQKPAEKVLEGVDKLYDDLKPKVKFACYMCGMLEMCHYMGKEPTFVSGKIKLSEDSYVMRDPFCTPPPLGKPKPEYFIIVGAHCFVCRQSVCKDLCCSFFYIATYCLECVKRKMTELPKEVQVKAKKQISNLKI